MNYLKAIFLSEVQTTRQCQNTQGNQNYFHELISWNTKDHIFVTFRLKWQIIATIKFVCSDYPIIIKNLKQ